MHLYFFLKIKIINNLKNVITNIHKKSQLIFKTFRKIYETKSLLRAY